MSAAVSSTSSNTADQRTFASWFAPTADSGASSTNTRSDGDGLRRDSAGTRTSKPAATSRGPVTVISSHASSWLRITWPRRVPPGPQQRGQHAFEARDLVFEVRTVRRRPSTIACSIGTSSPFGPGREHREVPRAAVVGRIEPHDQPLALAGDRARPPLDRGRDLARDAHRRVERAAVEPGEERFGDIGDGAHARRRRRHLEPARAVAADRVDHAGERGTGQRARVDVADRTRTRRRACVSARRARRPGSTSAGVQRTEYEPFDSRALAAAALALPQHAAPSRRAR